jgi:hypothetical protein
MYTLALDRFIKMGLEFTGVPRDNFEVWDPDFFTLVCRIIYMRA